MTLKDLALKKLEVREARKELAARDSALAAEQAELDEQIIAILDEQGLNALAVDAGDARLSLSISETVVPTVTDWTAVYDYIGKTGHFQLFERRMSSAAYRELRALHGELAGVQPFTKRAVNMQRRVAS